MLADARTGKNGRHALVGLLRQSFPMSSRSFKSSSTDINLALPTQESNRILKANARFEKVDLRRVDFENAKNLAQATFANSCYGENARPIKLPDSIIRTLISPCPPEPN